MQLLCHLSYATKHLLDIRNRPSVPPSAGSKLTAYEWKPPKIKVNLLSYSVPWNKGFMWNKVNINDWKENTPLCNFLFCLCFCLEWMGSLHLQLLVGLNSRFYLGIFIWSYTPLPAHLQLKELKQRTRAFGVLILPRTRSRTTNSDHVSAGAFCITALVHKLSL